MNTQIQIFFRRNETYVAIESCLAFKSTDHAAHLHGAPGKKSQSLVFGIDANEVLVDVFDVERVELQEQLVESCSFYHPATFDTIAVDTKEEEKIISELVASREGKEYHAKTGKSSMIAAMTSVKDKHLAKKAFD
uniref:Uncharacterized protein n=1 Tax=Populus alba TaxID=43335 RepID=A0A4U5QEB2_POPAL|nr:uncharacterized protein D5086_0000101690 [Populus alba]